MTLRVAQFSLKIAHLSLSMVLRGPRACGLRPRLWLLLQYRNKRVQFKGVGSLCNGLKFEIITFRLNNEMNITEIRLIINVVSETE